MLVGIRQCRALRRLANAEMDQLTQTTAQPVTDLAQGVRMRQLTEHHGNHLRPAVKTLRCPFGLVFLH